MSWTGASGDFVPRGFPSELLESRELMNEALLGKKDRSALAADLRGSCRICV